MDHKLRRKQVQALTAAVKATVDYPLVRIRLCAEITNAVTVTGEVRQSDHDALTEIIRRHGFIPLSEDLFVRY